MKAIIPVAGAGTTLRPHTHTHPKPLIPVAGKPILGHIIDNLMEAEVRELIFVVGYLEEKIRGFVEEYAREKGFIAHFVRQEPRRGLAHAINLCKAAIADVNEVIITLGDTIVDTNLKELAQAEESLLCVQQVDEPWEYGIAVEGEDGYIRSLVEKPSIPKSNLALVGLYKIVDVPSLMQATDYLIENDIRTRGEFQLTDALDYMVQNGARMRVQRVNNWFNCGKKEVLLQTNRLLLKKMEQHSLRNYPQSIILPPVFLPENVVIEHSIVGPNVAVGENAVIRNSLVSDSILGAYSSLESVILKESVIGNDTRLVGRGHSINIGDNTELDFNT